jgi:hypothetical protein
VQLVLWKLNLLTERIKPSWFLTWILMLLHTVVQIFTWNTDAWGYNQNTTSLYQAHPWVFAVLPNGEAFGVLADTSCRCEVNLLGAGSWVCKLGLLLDRRNVNH